MAEQFLTCPECGAKIPLTEALTSDLESKIRGELKSQVAEKEKAFNIREKDLKKKEIGLNDLKSSIEDEIQERVSEKELAIHKRENEVEKLKKTVLKQVSEKVAIKEKELDKLREEMELDAQKKVSELEKKATEKEKKNAEVLRQREEEIEIVKASVTKEIETELAKEKKKLLISLGKEAEAKFKVEMELLKHGKEDAEKRIHDFQDIELDLRKKNQKLESSYKDLEIEVARKIDEQKQLIIGETENRLNEAHSMKLRERDEKEKDMRNQIEILKRKSEQGSQQLQGEVMELELEDNLSANFPEDNIKPIQKGVKGADIEQHVKDERGKECGIIIWESKRTKNWVKSWITKVKEDRSKVKGDIAVIVSQTLPADVDSFAMIEGVWVCKFNSAIILAAALRAGLLEVARTRVALAGKSKKSDAIYDYITGQEFRHIIE